MLLVGACSPKPGSTVESARQRWDRFWTRKHSVPEDLVNTKPNPFLKEVVRGRHPGATLDVGMGSGRNSIFLAQEGWDVTGVDISGVAVESSLQRASELGLKLNAIRQDAQKFDFGIDRWDLVVLMYVGVPQPEVIRRIYESLRPGGLVILEHYHRDYPGSEHVQGLEPSELLRLFSEFKILLCEKVVIKPDWDAEEGPMVRLLAEKP